MTACTGFSQLINNYHKWKRSQHIQIQVQAVGLLDSENEGTAMLQNLKVI
jgi:hypothetical protein